MCRYLTRLAAIVLILAPLLFGDRTLLLAWENGPQKYRPDWVDVSWFRVREGPHGQKVRPQETFTQPLQPLKSLQFFNPEKPVKLGEPLNSAPFSAKFKAPLYLDLIRTTSRTPPEEATMLRLKLPIWALIASAAMATAVEAADSPELRESIDNLNKAIRELREVRRDFNDLRDAQKKDIDAVKAQIETLELRVKLLQNEIDTLRKEKTTGSISLKPDNTTPNPNFAPVPPVRSTGRLRIVNEFPEEMSVLVNGRSYRVLPGEERTILVPSGAFEYQIPQLQRFPQQREIAENQVKTIVIYRAN